jgi:hypothetical protein
VVQLPQILPRFIPLGATDEPQYILLEQAVAAREQAHQQQVDHVGLAHDASVDLVDQPRVRLGELPQRRGIVGRQGVDGGAVGHGASRGGVAARP